MTRHPMIAIGLSIGVVVIGIAIIGCDQQANIDAGYPRQPIKVVVPFGAGGGSDIFTRIVQKGIDDEGLLAESLVIINVPGAGTTLGSRRVKNARPDGYTVLCLHEAILTAKYSGNASYGPEAFEPIAATSQVGMVIAVTDDSKYKSLNALLDDAAGQPNEVLFCANLGAPSHFAGRLLEDASDGAKFRYVQAGGGAKRFAMMQGGHVAVSAYSIAEYIQFRPAGLRAVALLAEQRHPSIAEIPTAREQGFDVIASNTHFWWAPKGTPPDRIAVLRDVLRHAMESKSVRARLAEIVYDPIFLEGKALQERIADRDRRIAAVATEQRMSLPNFPLMVGCVTLLLAGIVSLQSIRNRSHFVRQEPFSAQQIRLALTCFLLIISYVVVMAVELVGFRTATSVFVLLFGFVLTRCNPRSLLSLAAIALVMSLGLHYVFTHLLVIDLP